MSREIKGLICDIIDFATFYGKCTINDHKRMLIFFRNLHKELISM